MLIRKFPIARTIWSSAKLWTNWFYLFLPPTGVAVVLFAIGILVSRVVIYLAGLIYDVVGEESFWGIYQKLKDCKQIFVCIRQIPDFTYVFLKNFANLGQYFFILVFGLSIVALAAFIMSVFVAGYSRISLDLVDTGKTELFRFALSGPLAPRIMAAAFVYLSILVLPVSLMICLVGVFFWLSSVLSAAWLSWSGINLLYVTDVFIMPALFFIVIPMYGLAVRLSLFPYFIVDQKLGVFESLIASFENTTGNTLRMMITHLIFLSGFLIIAKLGDSWWIRIGFSLTYLIAIFPYQFIFFAKVYAAIAERE